VQNSAKQTFFDFGFAPAACELGPGTRPASPPRGAANVGCLGGGISGIPPRCCWPVSDVSAPVPVSK